MFCVQTQNELSFPNVLCAIAIAAAGGLQALTRLYPDICAFIAKLLFSLRDVLQININNTRNV